MAKDRPLVRYAQVILHSGCAIPPINETEPRLHKWAECRSQGFYLKIAAKQQHKLKSNGLAIGTWISEKRFKALIMSEYYCPEDGEHHTQEFADTLWKVFNGDVAE